MMTFKNERMIKMFEKTVLAVRIYYYGSCGGNGATFMSSTTPMADLKMSDGVVETIQWNDVKQRKEFLPLITGYTLIYDERPKRPWEEW